jgi:hypothetical protein
MAKRSTIDLYMLECTFQGPFDPFIDLRISLTGIFPRIELIHTTTCSRELTRIYSPILTSLGQALAFAEISTSKPSVGLDLPANELLAKTNHGISQNTTASGLILAKPTASAIHSF